MSPIPRFWIRFGPSVAVAALATIAAGSFGGGGAALAVLATSAVAGLIGAQLQFKWIDGLLATATNRLEAWTPDTETHHEFDDWPQLAKLFDEAKGRIEALHQSLAEASLRNHERAAVLASMTESVIAVDSSEQVISLNNAAASLLLTTPEQARGRHIQEIVRSTDLRRFVARTLQSQTATEGEVVMGTRLDQTLQAHGTPLAMSSGGARSGAVVVLNDVTRLRRLENLRKEFVANVSHELKTPITSIKGFVETLLDGAMENPGDAKRFLTIIAQQSDRLNAIIDDLLALSKIEQGEGTQEIALEIGELDPVLRSAIRQVQTKAEEGQIRVQFQPGSCQARINPTLLEQAVINLLDNAIKYSPKGSEVQLNSHNGRDVISIVVVDHGNGIPPDQLERIFERFYRVDKARSRQLGGTGLGLAIVKHIVQAHHGHVRVESTIGKGSRFSIHIPALNS